MMAFKIPLAKPGFRSRSFPLADSAVSYFCLTFSFDSNVSPQYNGWQFDVRISEVTWRTFRISSHK
jgi:hypothetical protein